MKLELKKCARCGVVWYAKGYHVLYCADCRPIVARESQRGYHEKERQEREAKKQKKAQMKTVAQINQLAAAEGMSYGKYCLKYGI